MIPTPLVFSIVVLLATVALVSYIVQAPLSVVVASFFVGVCIWLWMTRR